MKLCLCKPWRQTHVCLFLSFRIIFQTLRILYVFWRFDQRGDLIFLVLASSFFGGFIDKYQYSEQLNFLFLACQNLIRIFKQFLDFFWDFWDLLINFWYFYRNWFEFFGRWGIFQNFSIIFRIYFGIFGFNGALSVFL